ncbi:SET domain-containing protein SmydA-8 isoform X1 [Anabrus simplex]|uniref:SET domain-containing protein SmydA-8 isoform X1 n=1 Tax=Anabrus simplex TaxID=316456 RepID=UPI0035A3190E
MHRSRKHKKAGNKKHRNRQHGEKVAGLGKREDSADELEEEKENLPYSIEISDVMGRYLVAAKNLRAGDVIVSEFPLVVGPAQGCQPLCLGCYKRLCEDGPHKYRCSGCGWPLCGPDCPGFHTEYGHSEAECSLFAKKPQKFPDDLTECSIKSQYQAIVPLRCLLLKTVDPAKWRTLLTMESHNEVRRKIPVIWKTNQLLVVDRIRSDWGMDHFSEDEIHTICGILEVNAFEIGQHGMRSLYPSAFLLAHDCVPNTSHCDDDEYRITIRASRDINKGRPITLSYAYTLQGTLKRREHLKESKFFDCCCRRCSDPTELGTYAGALKCPKCQPGYVLSTAPLDNSAVWRCENCDTYTITAEKVCLLMDRISKEVEAIDVNDVVAFEAFLKRYCNVLHENHYHMLSVKHSLSQLYGKIDGYTINEMTDEQLKRKRDICQSILKVFDVLEPGYSRLRGECLYELHAPIMVLATRGFESKRMTKKELAIQLKKVVHVLKEATEIFSYEPENSSEGMIREAAKDALARMKEWQTILNKF